MTAGARCLACGAGGLRAVRPYRLDSPHARPLFGGAQLYECAGCGLVQMAPLPDGPALDRYYAETYRSGGKRGAEAASADDFPRDNLFFLHRGESIAALLAPLARERGLAAPRILDVGAGFGHILHALGQAFPDSRRFALEISDVCVRHLRSIGISVFTVPTEAWLDRSTESFDIIVLSHVLEHLRDPVATLRRLRERLTPRGLLYVEVPNIPAGSLTRYPDHPWAPRFDEPHLTFFSEATLRGVLERAGLAVAFLSTAGPHYREVPAWRYRMPPLVPLAASLLPAGVKRFLRRQRFTAPVQTFGAAGPFFQYGGAGIWLRSVSTPGEGSGP